jgi:predicted permease
MRLEHWIYTIPLRLRSLFRRQRVEQELDEELRYHIESEIEEYVARGMNPEEARRAALLSMNGIEQRKEECRDTRRVQWLEDVWQDMRYGLRWLRKSPMFTVAAALTIALGVGANTAVFSLIDAVLLRSLPVQDPKELIFLQAAGSAGPPGAPPYPCFARLRAETVSFAGMAAFSSDELRIEIDGKSEQVMGQVASGNYFELLGVQPVVGRLMDADDEKLNPPVAVISHRYWQRRFGGDPAVIGKTISFREQTFTIVGVTPPEFWGLQPGTAIDLTLPITVESKHLVDSGEWWLQGIVARLKPGVSDNQAQAESNVVFQSFMSGTPYPADLIRNRFHHLELGPAAHGLDMLRRRFSKPLYVLMGIVILVLLMATLNIANLLLARGINRCREFAIRLAMGARRGRLLRQLLTETLLLFAFGSVPGVFFASWGVGIIKGFFAQGRRPITLEADLNWRVLAFSILITLVAGLVSGLFPAWRAFRTDPEQTIKEGQTPSSESRASATLTRALVALQVAVSLVLLVGAVTFLRTLMNLRNVDSGFANEQVLTMSIELPEGYVEAGKSNAIWSHVLEAVRRIPAVQAASISTLTPLSGRDRAAPVRVRGYEPPSRKDSVIHVNQVSEGYFETLGIGLLRGRLLTERDAEEAIKVALINQSAARKYFADRDPIGESLEFDRGGTAKSVYQIIGVVRDTKHRDLRGPSPPFAFIPIRQPLDAERRVTLAVASTAPNGPMALMPPIRSSLAAIDPRLLISEVISLRQQLDSTLLTERLLSGLAGAFGVLALILASIGLYGVLSYRVGRQRQSIGIRMALGASPISVALSVLGQSGLVVAVGLLSGLPFAFFAARMADSMSWGVKSSDPTIYIVGAALLSLVGVASAYLPARRAAAIDPAEALRHE